MHVKLVLLPMSAAVVAAAAFDISDCYYYYCYRWFPSKLLFGFLHSFKTATAANIE